MYRLAILALLAAPLVAQACPPGQNLLKNDVLPDAPAGVFAVGLVSGLCENEAAMSILQAGGPVKVHSVSAMFAQAIGTNGATAAVDVEIYDGITDLGAGRWQLGPQVFKLSNFGSNLQLTTHGINTYTLPAPVSVASGTVVVGFRMVANSLNGNCLSGYTANFATDATSQCIAGKNVLDALNHGPIDPAVYGGFGVPLCPLFFSGSWIIRACVEPDLAITWTGNPTPGGLVQMQLQAPGHGSEYYLVLGSGGISTGFTTPWGHIPLDNDWFFQCMLADCRSAMLLSGFGALDPMGNGFSVLLIPNLPILLNSGFTIYMGYATWPVPPVSPFSAVSPPSAPIVIN